MDILRPLHQLIFNLNGWKTVGDFEHVPDKFIIAIAPHTSNWDFMIGVHARSILNIRKTKFLAKEELFTPPFGWLFKALGGYPVVRKESQNQVDAVIEIFNKHDKFSIAVAPEGTRKKVERLKSGFYHIAVGAKVPIIMVGFDYAKKEVIVKEPFLPTGDYETDMSIMLNFFKSVTGKNPKNGIAS